MVVVLASLLLVGCAAAPNAQPGTGKKILARDITYDRLWVTVVPVITRRLDIKEIDKGKGYIRAKQSLWGLREYLAVQISPQEGAADQYEIEVISTRKEWNDFRWDEEILADIRGRLQRNAKPE
jgi:hypothetical protein